MLQNELQIKSDFHRYREQYQPRVPKQLECAELSSNTTPVSVKEEIGALFPTLCKDQPLSVRFAEAPSQDNAIKPALRIGCVLSGGQAAGGHNVIVGVYEYIKKRNPNSQLFGFLKGPAGIYNGKSMELRDDVISYFKNRGGRCLR